MAVPVESDRDRITGLEALEALFAAAPAVEAHYTMQDQGDGEFVLQPAAVLRKLERRWCETFPQVKPSLTATQTFDDEMWNDPDDWLNFLGHNPLAWQSFDARGVALLKVNLDTTTYDGGALAWGWHENRPALRLLAHGAYHVLEDPTRGVGSDAFIEHAEMLLVLNPNDNHGIREQLSCAYLMRGWPEKAVALTDRYPDDFCDPALNRILALLSVGRVADARAELMVAVEQHDVAFRVLIAKKPRPPKVDDGFGIMVGGKQEAWLYRESARVLWERDGRLDWLKKELKKARRS